MNTHHIEFFAELRQFGRRIDLHMVVPSRGEGDPAYMARNVTFTAMAEDEQTTAFVDPPLSFSIRSAQSLMDQLWKCGLRPSEGRGSAGALAATQAHLADMRDIAQQALEVALGRSE